MQLEHLRARHHTLHYRSFTIERHRECIALQFAFELEPGISFRPGLVVECDTTLSDEQLAPLAFHVGMAELASYWKCACPRRILISAGQLSTEQLSWWHDLLMHGMGEFYFQNQIDFTRPDFLQIECSDQAPLLAGPLELAQNATNTKGCILTAGGKDSTLSLELLREQRAEFRPMVLNPTRAALASADIAGYRYPIVLRRSIDPTLLSLNAQGYLNGHTPFSSYLAFAALFAAAVAGCREILVSNEKSANQENLVYHDMPINHQYSKSVRFERMFRAYSARHLSPSLSYFSFLRPLYDIQVAGLFAKHCKAHFSSFRSCNVASKQDGWCAECPKCAFTYLALAAFLPFSQVCQIFGKDPSMQKRTEEQLRGLIGLSPIKPFECVGTREESLQALRLAVAKESSTKDVVPELLIRLAEESSTSSLEAIDLSNMGEEHFIPEDYLYLLEDAVYANFPQDDI